MCCMKLFFGGCVMDGLTPDSVSVTASGLSIINCYIEYNPDLMICKECPNFRDCKIHHVVIEDAYKVLLPLEAFDTESP